jgi:5-methylcytosine-specific restriction endonuclease McrA
MNCRSVVLLGNKFAKENPPNHSTFKVGEHTGKNHPRWKGGWREHRGPGWKKQKSLLRERDKNCRICRVSPILAHHIIPYRETGNSSLTNLLGLCFKCHTKIEHEYEKKLKELHVVWRKDLLNRCQPALSVEI